MRSVVLLLVTVGMLFSYDLTKVPELTRDEFARLKGAVVPTQPTDPTLCAINIFLPEVYEGKTYKQVVYIPDRADPSCSFVMATSEGKRIVDVVFRRKDAGKPVLILSYGTNSASVRLDPATVIGYLDLGKFVEHP